MPRAIAVDYKASLNFGAAGATTNAVSFTRPSSMLAANLTSHTSAAWVKVRSTGGGSLGRLMDSGPATVFTQNFSASSQCFVVQVSHSTTNAQRVSSNLQGYYNQWVRLLYTWTSGNAPDIYLNGNIFNSTFTTPVGTKSDPATTIYIGNRSDLIRGFDGYISDLCIWNRVLSATEIAQDASGAIPPSGLISRKYAQDGAGSTMTDSIDASINGTISGATYTSDTPSKARSLVGGNLVQNGSFEYAPPFVAATAVSGGTSQWIDGTATGSGNALFGWNIASNTTAAGSAMFDANNANTGTYSLKMVCTTAHANGLVAQLHPLNVRTSATTPYMPKLQAGRSYTLTGYVTTSGISNTTAKGAAIRVIEDTESGYNNVQNFSAYVNGTTAKQQLSVTFTAAANTTRAEVCVGIFGETGTAWFDDITLTETVPVGRSVVQDFRASLSFNGTSTALTSPVVPATTGFSFGIWLKVPNSTNTRYIDWETALNTDGFSITSSGTGANTLTWNINGAAGNIKSIFATNFPVGQWVHVAATFTPSAQALYVNGVLASSSATAAAMTTATGQTLTFGKRSYSASYAAAQMAGIVWQNTATPWTQQEVIQIMNSIQKSGANAIHVLGEGAGPTALDSSGNGNNGTITAGTYSADVPSRKRQVVGGNMVANGDFEYAPPFTAATTTSGRWIDGTAAGSTTIDLFGWALRNKSGTGSAQYDSSVKYNGNYSLKLSLPGTGSRASAQRQAASSAASLAQYAIPVLPNTSYTVTCRMKTNYVSGDSVGALIGIVEYTASNTTVLTTLSTGIKNTVDWTLYSLVITTNSTTRFIDIVPDIQGSSGTATLIMDAWFDDITLTPTTNTTRTLVA